MASPDRLSNDEFFTQLTTLFASASAKEKTSVFLTQKALLPFTPAGAPAPETPAVDPYTTDAPLQLLIRATNGDTDKKKKLKFSTVVEAADLEAFFARYAEVAKSGMTALKKRDRKAKKLRARKKGKKGAEGAAGAPAATVVV